MDLDLDDIAYAPTVGVSQVHTAPLVLANEETVKGYGRMVDAPDDAPIEIVRWPAQGWRPIDPNSGDQGGTTEGIFEFWWRGQTLFARNNAVGDSYLFGWSELPEAASDEGPASPRERALIWRANYHPDGGQLFFPLDGQSFVVPVAMPGDDVTPADFIALRCDGGRGLYIHPGIWHGAVAPLTDHARFFDRQGKVHARVSVDFPKEFGCYLAVSLT